MIKKRFDIYIRAIIVMLCLIAGRYTAHAVHPAFDRIRPLAEQGLSLAKSGKDDEQALTLLTEALMRGEEWVDTDTDSSESVDRMAEIVEQTILLRHKLRKEPEDRLLFELMLRSAVEATTKEDVAYHRETTKYPELADEKTISKDEASEILSGAIQQMEAGRLKECERNLLRLYSQTWHKGLLPEYKHQTANCLGILYLKLGTFEQAYDILRQNKLDIDASGDPELLSPDSYTECLFLLALACKAKEWMVAARCYLETCDAFSQRAGVNSKSIITEVQRGLMQGPKPSLQILDFIKENDRNLCFLTDSQREERWERIRPLWENIKDDLTDENGGIKDINACLNAFQYEKQIMLRSIAKTRQAMKALGDTEAAELIARLQALRLQALETYTVDNKEILADYERSLKQLMHHPGLDRLEGGLYHPLTAKDIAARLKDGETFIDFGLLDTEGERRWYAIIITPSCPEGLAIRLCSYDELKGFLESTTMPSAKRTVESRYGDGFLYEKIWKPIIETGLAGKRILYSPAGMMNAIMPDAVIHDGRYLGEDHEFHILSSAEALAGLRKGESYRPKSIVSFGAIDYSSPQKETLWNRAITSRNAIPPLLRQEDFIWMEDLGRRKGFEVDLLTGHGASEEAFRNLSGQNCGALNVFTHAFSIPEGTDLMDYPYLRSYGLNTRNYDLTLKNLLPLFRTGLMLSGAEKAWTEGTVVSAADDGIINGEEISALDLCGLELVTLLACDTGSGDIDELEGIMGLRRALKTAGCGSLVTAAWSLDLEAADAYLREFYSALADGVGVSGAHRQAQLELIRRFDSPYYWAAFQMID